MQQSVIVYRERISRSGEMKYFQIPLPGTEKKIIGIETSIFLLTALPVPPTTPPDSGGGTSTGTPTPECPNPGTASVDPVSDTVAGSVRTQVFRIGSAVNPGFTYSCAVYGVTMGVTAVSGDTPASIAASLAFQVNSTDLAVWNMYGSNNQNYKPTASSSGDLLTLTTDNQHSFFAGGQGSCGTSGPPPPPPPPTYDPLFTIKNNDKAGILSLQSADRTDIFYQGEVFGGDKNITFGDYSTKYFFEIGEWVFGKRRVSSDVLITTNSPIIEAYYKDMFGPLYNLDINYLLNIFIWLEKQ